MTPKMMIWSSLISNLDQWESIVEVFHSLPFGKLLWKFSPLIFVIITIIAIIITGYRKCPNSFVTFGLRYHHHCYLPTQWVFTMLLWAVYPLGIVDQTTIGGNGEENPVEIGLISTIEERFFCIKFTALFFWLFWTVK